ncbi:hypothetical protein J7L68_07705 [bacterium]|nr:hypothetical protein [bacterium]
MGIHKVICHFCSMQDYFGLTGESVFYSVHYGSQNVVKTKHFSERRICPRGNFCNELAQHKHRVGYNLVDGEFAKTDFALDAIKESFSAMDKSRSAILLSGSLTLEEALLAAKLGEKWGTKLVAQIFPEDEISAKFLNNFSFADLSKMQAVIAIGDIFSLHPTISKFVHDARFADRKNFLAAIDNCRSRTSRFAWSFLNAKPGSVADVIEALANAVSCKEYSIENTGVDESAFEQLVSILKNTENAAVLFSPGIGRFSEPLRVGFWAKELAESKNFQFASFSTGSNARGISRLLNSYGFEPINKVIDAIESGEVESLMCLECDPIEAFPKIFNRIKSMKLVVTTATLPTAIVENANIVISSKHLFEKKGTLLSPMEKIITMDDPFPSPDYPGEMTLLKSLLENEGIRPTAEISEIKEHLGAFHFISEPPDVMKNRSGKLTAVGYHTPHHHGDGSYTRRASWVIRQTKDKDNSVIIGLGLAEEIGVSNGDSLVVSTDAGKSEFSVIIEEDQLDNVVLIPAYMPNGRDVLGWCKSAGFVPIAVTVSKP